MRASLHRVVGLATSFCLGSLLLVWIEDAYTIRHYLGALDAFAALALLGAAVAIVAPPRGTSVRRTKNVGWCAGAGAAAWYAVGLVVARTIGVPGYHQTGWGWVDVIRLLLAAGYLGAFAAFLRRGGAPTPQPPRDWAAVWRAALPASQQRPQVYRGPR
jgi:MFS family permease